MNQAEENVTNLHKNEKKRNRGIYLLPNLFTTAALFSGFYAILSAMNGQFEISAIAIFIAMILDGLDGRVARLTNTETAFGAEFDSLSDMVAFGVAPALVLYEWALADLGKLGWLAAFVYIAGTALRLARFNAQMDSSDDNYFHGLPSPSAAAIVAGTVWLAVDYDIVGTDYSMIVAAISVSAGLLMVSNVKYSSFKHVDLRGKVPFIAIVGIMLLFAVTLIHPPLVAFVVFLGYVISGPFLWLKKLAKETK